MKPPWWNDCLGSNPPSSMQSPNRVKIDKRPLILTRPARESRTFKCDDAMLDVLSVAVVVFPGTGTSENSTDYELRPSIVATEFKMGS